MGDPKLTCAAHQLATVATRQGRMHRLEVDGHHQGSVSPADGGAELELLLLLAAPDNGFVILGRILLGRLSPVQRRNISMHRVVQNRNNMGA
jgi:hypothetical protein